MGRSYRPKSFQAIDAGDMSANIIGTYSDVEHRDRALYNVEWNGTGVSGEIFVEYTNDDPTKSPTWTALDFGSPISLAVDTGDHQILIQAITWKYMRIRYAFSAGTGTLNAEIKSAAQAV